MEIENKDLILSGLGKFILKIRRYPISNQVYRYYISDYSQINKDKVKIRLDYNSINVQAQRKIFINKNNYWSLSLSEMNAIDTHVAKFGNLDLFKDDIEKFLNLDLDDQIEKSEQEEKEKENKEKDIIISIVGESLYDDVIAIIKDNREYRYKSDKVKALLNIKLNVDQIFSILGRYEEWVCQRSYIEKYHKERIDLIVAGKIK